MSTLIDEKRKRTKIKNKIFIIENRIANDESSEKRKYFNRTFQLCACCRNINQSSRNKQRNVAQDHRFKNFIQFFLKKKLENLMINA